MLYGSRKGINNASSRAILYGSRKGNNNASLRVTHSFNKISRITKLNINQSKLLPYPLSLKQRSQETIFIRPERGDGSGLSIANSAIIKSFVSRCSQLRCRLQCFSCFRCLVRFFGFSVFGSSTVCGFSRI